LTKVSVRVGVVRLGLTVVLAVTGLSAGIGGASVIEPAPSAPAKAPRRVAESPIAKNASVAKAGDAFSLDAWSSASVSRMNPRVLELALRASRCAASNGVVEDPATLTIIDYSKPSIEPRMWVLDLDTRKMLYEELVAHGQGSGGNLATKFSNKPDSHQTSLGLFVTETTYVGRNGYSLRLTGLERGFNDRARERAIVMHGAPYVSQATSKQLGRLGRSHGCPAVREPIARELIDRVKGGSLVFAYYPDAEWLKSSQFLTGCGSTPAGA
jgi:hypothetical protein